MSKEARRATESLAALPSWSSAAQRAPGASFELPLRLTVGCGNPVHWPPTRRDYHSAADWIAKEAAVTATHLSQRLRW